MGLSSENAPDQYKPFLSSLAVAGSISIHLCQKETETETDSDDYIIRLLNAALRQQNKEAFELAEKVKQCVKDFTAYLNDGSYTTLKKISGLIYYELSFLESYISDQKALSILRGCLNVLEKGKSSSRESEILAIVYTFVDGDEKVESLHQMGILQQELKDKFLTYVHQQTMVETVLSFEEDYSIASKETLDKETESIDAVGILKKKLGLSTREIEVINYVLKGCNNREIALKLFISEHTVKNHITRILQKLGVSDRSQAIAMIYQLGYTPL